MVSGAKECICKDEEPGGQTFHSHRRRGADKHFSHTRESAGGYDDDDVDEEMDVSKASKLSAGAGIFSSCIKYSPL